MAKNDKFSKKRGGLVVNWSDSIGIYELGRWSVEKFRKAEQALFYNYLLRNTKVCHSFVYRKLKVINTYCQFRYNHCKTLT